MAAIFGIQWEPQNYVVSTCYEPTTRRFVLDRDLLDVRREPGQSFIRARKCERRINHVDTCGNVFGYQDCRLGKAHDIVWEANRHIGGAAGGD
jgi:hypothetical protein